VGIISDQLTSPNSNLVAEGPEQRSSKVDKALYLSSLHCPRLLHLISRQHALLVWNYPRTDLQNLPFFHLSRKNTRVELVLELDRVEFGDAKLCRRTVRAGT
jgi:hypothetical protein